MPYQPLLVIKCAKAIIVEEQLWYYLTYSWVVTRRFIPFLKSINSIVKVSQSAGAVEYTNCISAKGLDHSSMCALDMTLNTQVVRLQSWRFEECKSTPSLPLLPGPLRPGVVALDRVLFMGQIEQTMCANK